MNPTHVPGNNEFKDLCSLAMDRAIGTEKASPTPVVELKSSVNDVEGSALWFVPVLGDLLRPAANVFALCVELQMSWLKMMVPHANGDSDALLPVAAASTIAIGSGEQAVPKAAMAERSMDIAIGARAGRG